MRNFFFIILFCKIITASNPASASTTCVEALEMTMFKAFGKVHAAYPESPRFEYLRQGRRAAVGGTQDTKVALIQMLLENSGQNIPTEFTISLTHYSYATARDAILNFLESIEKDLPANTESIHYGSWSSHGEGPYKRLRFLPVTGIIYASTLLSTPFVDLAQFDPRVTSLVGLLGSACAITGSCIKHYSNWKNEGVAILQKSQAFFAEIRERLRDGSVNTEPLVLRLEQTRLESGRETKKIFELEYIHTGEQSPHLRVRTQAFISR